MVVVRVPWKDPAGRLSVWRRGYFKVLGVSWEGAHSGSGELNEQFWDRPAINPGGLRVLR